MWSTHEQIIASVYSYLLASPLPSRDIVKCIYYDRMYSWILVLSSMLSQLIYPNNRRAVNTREGSVPSWTLWNLSTNISKVLERTRRSEWGNGLLLRCDSPSLLYTNFIPVLPGFQRPTIEHQSFTVCTNGHSQIQDTLTSIRSDLNIRNVSKSRISTLFDNVKVLNTAIQSLSKPPPIKNFN